MVYNNFPFMWKILKQLFFFVMFKSWEGEKKSKCFIAVAEQREKILGFKLSGLLWALSIPDILYLLNAAVSWSQRSFSSVKYREFYQHREFPPCNHKKNPPNFSIKKPAFKSLMQS